MKLAKADRGFRRERGEPGFRPRPFARPCQQARYFPDTCRACPQGKRPFGSGRQCAARENLPLVDGFLERTAATDKAFRETSAIQERIVPATDEIVQHSGDLTRERANATAVLSGALSRRDGIDGKMTNAAPFRQDVARLEKRIGVLVRTLDSEPKKDGRGGDTERTGVGDGCSTNLEPIAGTGRPRGRDSLPGFSPFR